MFTLTLLLNFSMSARRLRSRVEEAYSGKIDRYRARISRMETES
jgi:hypothetical protein